MHYICILSVQQIIICNLYEKLPAAVGRVRSERIFLIAVFFCVCFWMCVPEAVSLLYFNEEVHLFLLSFVQDIFGNLSS